MADRQIEKAQEIAREHGARIAETAGLADDLRQLKDQLSEPGADKARAAASSPQVRKAFELMKANAEPVQLGPSPMVFPQTSPIDFDGIRQVAQEVSETRHAAHAEKRDREHRMMQTLEAMRAELAASGEREAETLARAENAEDDATFMRRVTVAALAVAIVTLFVALSAPAS